MDTVAGLNYETHTGQLHLDGIAMKNPAWSLIDIRVLWLPAAVRGADRLLPTAAGVRPFPRRRTVTVHTFDCIITGTANVSGAPPAVCNRDAIERQLEANVSLLRSLVVDPITTPGHNGTRQAVLTMPSGAKRTGPVHVLPFTLADASWHSWKIGFSLSVPYGVLA
jgi:hypothetical protein